MDTLKPLLDTFKPIWSKLKDNRGEVATGADPAPAADPAAPANPSNPTPGVSDPSLHDPAPLAPGNTGDPAPDPEPTPAADPEPAPTAAKNWYDSLSEDLRNNPTIQKYKSQEDAHKAHLELQKIMGNEKIALPKDENDEVAIKALNKALGVPEEATGENGYKFEELEGMDGMEGMQFGDDNFAEIMLKYNVPQSAAAGLRQEYANLLKGIKEANEKAYVEAVNQSKTDLTKEWGLAYDSKVKQAQAVMNKFAGSKENFDYINAKIGADPIALKMLAEIGANFSEGSLGDMGNPKSQFTKTPAEAKAEYDTIMNDPNDVYWAGVRNKNIVPESVRKERVSYVESLLAMQNPTIPSAPAGG